jgi:hypothetical protein
MIEEQEEEEEEEEEKRLRERLMQLQYAATPRQGEGLTRVFPRRRCRSQPGTTVAPPLPAGRSPRRQALLQVEAGRKRRSRSLSTYRLKTAPAPRTTSGPPPIHKGHRNPGTRSRPPSDRGISYPTRPHPTRLVKHTNGMIGEFGDRGGGSLRERQMQLQDAATPRQGNVYTHIYIYIYIMEKAHAPRRVSLVLRLAARPQRQPPVRRQERGLHPGTWVSRVCKP